MPLDAVLAGEPEEAALVIVFLHGHDMRPEDLALFAPALGASVACHFVRGPCITASGANAWWLRDSAVTARRGEGPWDLHHEAPEGHLQAREMLGRYLRVLRLRHPGTPLLLAGFSQGGMVAMDTVLLEDVRVDALALFAASRIAFDTWAPRLQRLAGLPVLVAHGRDDEVIAFAAGQALCEAARQGRAQARWAAWEGGHEMSMLAWRELRRMVTQLLAAPA